MTSQQETLDGATLAPPAARERIAWIDAARALAVLGVVLFHIGFLHVQPRLADAAPTIGSLWNHVDGALGNFRMPMLLMLSGMLASGKVRRGLRGGTALESSVANYYLYLVWLVVYFITIWDTTFPLGVPSLRSLGTQVVLPYTTLWFVQCLAIGVLGLTLLHRFRPVVVLVPLLALHLVVAGMLPSDVAMPIRTLPFYLYLAIGVYFAPQVRRLAGSVKVTALAGLGFVVAYAANHVLEPRIQLAAAAAHLAACLCASVLLMGLVRMACHWAPFAAAGSFVGRRTLSIYVMHVPMVAAIRTLPQGYVDGLRSAFAAQPLLLALYPLALMALLAGLCLLLEVGMRRVGLGFLFSMPEALRERVRDLVGQGYSARHGR